MRTRVPIPKFVSHLLDVLEAEFPDAWLDVKRSVGLNEYRYTVAVVSARFRRMSWTRRRALLWQLAERCLTPKECARTTLLALRPVDLKDMTGEAFDPASPSRCRSAYAPPVEVLTFKPQIGALKRRAGTARRKLSHLKPV